MYNKFLAIVVSSFCIFSFLSVQRGYGAINCAGERQKLEDLLAQRDDTKPEDDRDILDKKIATQFGVVDKVCPKSYPGTATRLAGMALVDVGILTAAKNILDIFNHPLFLVPPAGQQVRIQPQFPLNRGTVLALCSGACVVVDVLIWFIP